MNQKTFLPTLWLLAFIVGLFQLPLIENTLLKYSFNTDLNEHISIFKNFQQQVEDSKIAMSASMENMNDIIQPTLQKNSIVSDVILQNTTSPSSIPNNLNSGTSSNNILPDSNQMLIDKTVKDTCQENCKVLMIGDSVMGDVDFSLSRLLKKSKPSWQVIDAHKVSSGLSNQVYYDWPKTADKLVSQHKPDYIVVLVGTNDAQNMMINGKGAVLGKDAWMTEYKNRVTQITKNFDSNNIPWLWIQLPVVKDVNFNQRLQFVRSVQQEIVGNNLVETESIFGKADHSQEVNMKLRAGDGTHLNSNGANMVAQHVYERMIQNTNDVGLTAKK